ncbi:MAG: hypothetical protein COV29_04240 [Candidatus Yanofskybacteria bacterium CG10_big_fil_rev_8_21_14_0_10_36_16]|uniref:MBL fold metallo-hydrolase n=1 Tax=Candidatus Yanofskybacteria bacterium CG10_big_fil_rev_8_21_14_0_10_36_16 TaxID=1975096 RepID=A0A2J0Q6D4_9BACT|nr:MAG: hypothetical protein COV29_04240 [Candidatus Yanofskybacteria bacterium CG10_big_fil_rev_8_21_14_0_10_36_16]
MPNEARVIFAVCSSFEFTKFKNIIKNKAIELLVVVWYNLSMNINYYGYSCFRLEGKNMSIMIDPFSKEIGLRAPRLGKDNILLTTHNHDDHHNLEGKSDDAFLVSGPGEYEKGGVQIEGIVSYHDENEGKDRGLNTIYVIRFEGIKFCHLGDFGEKELSHEQIESIGDIDVLFIPVGGKCTIDAQKALKIINQISPKMIVPMHYKTKDLKLDIEGPDKFIKEIGIKPEKVGTSWRINEKGLPIDETKLVMFIT